MPATKKAKSVVKPARRIAKSASSPKPAVSESRFTGMVLYNATMQSLKNQFRNSNAITSEKGDRTVSVGQGPLGFIVRTEPAHKAIYVTSEKALRGLINKYLRIGSRFSVEPVRITVSE